MRKEGVEFGGVTSTQFIDLLCMTMKSRKLPVQPPPFLVSSSTSLLSVSLVFLSLARQSRGTFGGHGAPNQSAGRGKGQNEVKGEVWGGRGGAGSGSMSARAFTLGLCLIEIEGGGMWSSWLDIIIKRVIKG